MPKLIWLCICLLYSECCVWMTNSVVIWFANDPFLKYIFVQAFDLSIWITKKQMPIAQSWMWMRYFVSPSRFSWHIFCSSYSVACIKLEEYQTAKAALETGASLAPGDSRFSKFIKECDELIAGGSDFRLCFCLAYTLNMWIFLWLTTFLCGKLN